MSVCAASIFWFYIIDGGLNPLLSVGKSENTVSHVLCITWTIRFVSMTVNGFSFCCCNKKLWRALKGRWINVVVKIWKTPGDGKKHQGPRSNGSSTGDPTPIRWQHLYHMFKTEWTYERQDLCIIFDAILKWCESVKRYSEICAWLRHFLRILFKHTLFYFWGWSFTFCPRGLER